MATPNQLTAPLGAASTSSLSHSTAQSPSASILSQKKDGRKGAAALHKRDDHLEALQASTKKLQEKIAAELI